MKKRQIIKFKGALNFYMRWPLITLVFPVLIALLALAVSEDVGKIAICIAMVGVIVTLFVYYYKRPEIMKELVNFASNYAMVQHRLMSELAVPYAVLDDQGSIMWANNDCMEILNISKADRQSIYSIFKDLSPDIYPKDGQDSETYVEYKDKIYRAVFRSVFSTNSDEDAYWSFEVDSDEARNTLVAMFLYDETEINALKKELRDSSLVVGLLYIDNYEEVMDSTNEFKRSTLSTIVERRIFKNLYSIDAIIKQLEKDKYVMVFQNRYLSQLKENKFPILDDVRSVSLGNDLPVTVSIGLSTGDASFAKLYENARAAIDLALGRGGDQAVLKEKGTIQYFGGKSASVEKNTRVRARVKAHALKEIIEVKEKIVIMGHSNGDVDSLGSAIGVYRIAKTLDKRAYIVAEDITNAIRPVYNRFKDNQEYESDMFISRAKAKDLIDSNTVLVIVDVNRPSHTEAPDLIKLCNTVVIIDHHRQTGDSIENPALSYIEPYASSACEMVAEILQYIGEDVKIRQLEADAMYAGIMIDTNNFISKTGVRTFEAAAYLRRSGADITRIRKMFRTDVREYLVKAEAVSSAEIYRDSYMFARFTAEGFDNPTVLAAQVANELMNIDGVKGSFVFTPYNEKINVSARSIDELNVQVVMEKVGGGGHMSIAGGQLEGTIEEAIAKVQEALDATLQ